MYNLTLSREKWKAVNTYKLKQNCKTYSGLLTYQISLVQQQLKHRSHNGTHYKLSKS